MVHVHLEVRRTYDLQARRCGFTEEVTRAMLLDLDVKFFRAWRIDPDRESFAAPSPGGGRWSATLVDVLSTDEGGDIDFEPERLGIARRKA